MVIHVLAQESRRNPILLNFPPQNLAVERRTLQNRHHPRTTNSSRASAKSPNLSSNLSQLMKGVSRTIQNPSNRDDKTPKTKSIPTPPQKSSGNIKCPPPLKHDQSGKSKSPLSKTFFWPKFRGGKAREVKSGGVFSRNMIKGGSLRLRMKPTLET